MKLEELRNPEALSRARKKLGEVDKVDNRDTSWTGTVTQLMSKFGFDKLGSGKYGSVFGKSNYPYVVKIFMKDSAYMKWISYCQKNKNNKYLPKFKGKVVKLADKFYACRIEKLKPGYGAVDPKTIMNAVNSNEEIDGDQDFVDLIKELRSNKKLLDIHGENLMKRGNTTVVVDPYYNWFKPGQGFTIDPEEFDKSIL